MRKNKVIDYLLGYGYTEDFLNSLDKMEVMELWLKDNGIVSYATDIAEMIEELFGVKLTTDIEGYEEACPVKEGQIVYWNDPDNGLGSGIYTVESIPAQWEEDSPISISNGYSTAEVFLCELWTKP